MGGSHFSAMDPTALHRRDVLHFLVHNHSPRRFHGQEGSDSDSPTEDDANQRPSTLQEPTSLCSFLRNPASLTHVAVSQRGDELGDIRDTKGEHLERSPFKRRRSLPDAGLERSSTSTITEAIDVEKATGVETIEVDSPDLEKQIKAASSWEGSTQGNNFHTEDLFGPKVSQTNEDSPNVHKQFRKEDASNSPWWKSLLASPMKTLHRWNTWSTRLQKLPHFPKLPPSFNSKDGKKVFKKGKGNAGKPRRQDLPTLTNPMKMGKPSMRKAVDLARRKDHVVKAVKAVEKDYYANSSRGARESRRNTINKLLRAATLGFPLDPHTLKVIAGCLKEAGYKSTHIYLAEAKIMHVEMGHNWSELLNRHFKLCLAAAKRGLGPAKKAPEVPEETWASMGLLPMTNLENTKVPLAPQLFACGVHWMLREIEIADLTTKDVTLDSETRTVFLNLKVSKTDQAARSVKRALQCLCDGACDIRCPFAVMEVLVHTALLRGTKDGHLAYTSDKSTATKAELVDSWSEIFKLPVTGHSTRRSGALQYIRKGWAVSQVAFLGRWKSNLILQYAQEALETMAVNAGCKFGKPVLDLSTEDVDRGVEKLNNTQKCLPSSQILEDEAVKAKMESLESEIKKLKTNTKVSKVEFQKSMDNCRQMVATSAKYLPGLVQSDRHRVVHINSKTLVHAPAYLWKTLCGWNYYSSVYTFVEGDQTKVTCNKCQSRASSEVDVAANASKLDVPLGHKSGQKAD